MNEKKMQAHFQFDTKRLKRITIASFIAIIVFYIRLRLWRNDPVLWMGDFWYPICEADALLERLDPYMVCQRFMYGRFWPLNPLTTVFISLPFLPLGSYAPTVMFSISSGLLAYALLYDDKWWRLLPFLSFPYFEALYVIQWSPFIVAIALLPNLLPLSLVKPHIAIPSILTNLTWQRIAGCMAFVMLTLIVDPTWPIRFLDQTRPLYDGVSPAFLLPFGPILLLSLIAWRQKSARYFLLSSLIPQRSYYDSFILFAIPLQTKIQMFFVVITGWIGALFIPYPFSLVLCMYFPMLSILLFNNDAKLFNKEAHLSGRPS